MPGYAGRFGSSVDSRSLSGSRPGSRMASAHYNHPLPTPEPGSSTGAWFIKRNTISPQLRARLIEELSINPLYVDRDRPKPGLRAAWGRYLECSQAIDTAKAMSAAGNWPTEIPSYTEYLVVDIFIGKTTWYGSYVKIFEPIKESTEFVDMKAWLDEEHPSNQKTEEIWGILQSTYSIEDMRAWVNNGGSLPRKKRSPTPDDRSKGKQRAHRKKHL